MDNQRGVRSADFYWNRLQHDLGATDEHIARLHRYAQLLVEWNKKFNLTTVIDEAEIIDRHFYDSLAITQYVNFEAVTGICDVGSGAGFPGVPLKIMFPHLHVLLIEVNNKRRLFLDYIVSELQLDNVIISPLDWVTFVRTSTYTVDYVFARASLQLNDLIRMFKPSSAYNNATLVYWASDKWKLDKKEALYYDQEISYVVDGIKRKYVFFNNK